MSDTGMRKSGRAITPRWQRAALAAFIATTALAAPAAAQAPPPVSVGGGLRTSFTHTEEGGGTDTLGLDDIRLYVNGTATTHLKLMFNTDYSGNELNVLDAVARFEKSDKLNIWMGRFLPPSDRANLYGPFYANHWGVYRDGVQDGYPFIFQGRDNGVAYWGQFGKAKLSGGVFDGVSATGDDTLLSAGRIQVDFWDPEAGYYQNGTYYGDKNLLAIGLAGQAQGAHKGAYSADFLLEHKVGDGGAFTIEAEWAKYDKLGGYDANYGTDQGGYVLGAYVFPTLSGIGRFQALAKYAQSEFKNGVTTADVNVTAKITEVNLNYLVAQFNARVMIFYIDTRYSAVRTNSKQFGVGLQIQM